MPLQMYESLAMFFMVKLLHFNEFISSGWFAFCIFKIVLFIRVVNEYI